MKLPRSGRERISLGTMNSTTLFNLSEYIPFTRSCQAHGFKYSAQNVGVIFKTDRDSFRVLDQNGQIRVVQPHQISMRRDSTRAIALDSEGHELRINDMVKEVEGEVSAPGQFQVLETQLVFLLLGSQRPSLAHPPILLCLPPQPRHCRKRGCLCHSGSHSRLSCTQGQSCESRG